MAAFTILTGKNLARAIKGFGQKVATFTQLQHQLAASALQHVEDHSCASHLNNLFAATPANYRAALRVWATHFGKVKFVAEPEEAGAHFVYEKCAKSDMPGAIATSPAEFSKAKNGAAEKAFDEVAAFEALLKRLTEKGGSARAVELANAAIRALKAPVAPAKPAPKAKATPVLAVDNAKPTPAAKPAAAQGALELAAA